MNSYLKAKIQKIISKTSQSNLKKHLNYFKIHSDNSIVKEIIIMINQNLSKKKKRNFYCLTITPFSSEGQKYPDIEIKISHEENFNYQGIVTGLDNELSKLNLELFERPPVFIAIKGTDTDVTQGDEFERDANYFVKIKSRDEEEKLSEENSYSDKYKDEENSSNSHQNQDKSQSIESDQIKEDNLWMHPVHDKSVPPYLNLFSEHSSSNHSSDLHLSNSDNNQSWKLTDLKSEEN